MRRWLLAISLSFNGFFIAGALFVLHKKGGLSYLKHRGAILAGSQVGIEAFPLYYQQRYSQFRGHPLPPSATVLAGDSLTELGDWDSLLGRGAIVNRGIGADTTVGLRFRLPDLTRPCPARLFLLIGIADLRIGRSPDRILETYRDLVQTFRTRCPATATVIQSLLPINHALFGPEIANRDIAEVNHGLEALARAQGATYLDLHRVFVGSDGELDRALSTDGVHLNRSGYEKWAALLEPHLR